MAFRRERASSDILRTSVHLRERVIMKACSPQYNSLQRHRLRLPKRVDPKTHDDDDGNVDTTGSHFNALQDQQTKGRYEHGIPGTKPVNEVTRQWSRKYAQDTDQPE